MKLTIATALLAMSALFAQTATPPAANPTHTKAEKHKKDKHKKSSDTKMEEKKTPPAKSLGGEKGAAERQPLFLCRIRKFPDWT